MRGLGLVEEKCFTKGAYHRFTGYANSQMKKIRSKKPTGSRVALVEKFGYDTKFAMHLVRLMSECEQILNEGNLDITLHREKLRNVRNGEWSFEYLEEWFGKKEIMVEEAYNKTELPYTYDEAEMKKLLLECLEIQYGTVSDAVGSEIQEKNLPIRRD